MRFLASLLPAVLCVGGMSLCMRRMRGGHLCTRGRAQKRAVEGSEIASLREEVAQLRIERNRASVAVARTVPRRDPVAASVSAARRVPAARTNEPTSPTRVVAPAPVVRSPWAAVDRCPHLLRIALVGGLGAAALALFGLPPVDLHTPLHHLGVMDPLCGMTRAVRFLARGDFRNAWRFNPGVFALALATAFVIARAAIGWRRGRWFEISTGRPRAAITIAVVAVAALELHQQLNASRLR